MLDGIDATIGKVTQNLVSVIQECKGGPEQLNRASAACVAIAQSLGGNEDYAISILADAIRIVAIAGERSRQGSKEGDTK